MILGPNGQAIELPGGLRSIKELIADLVDAEQKMSTKNSHKWLIRQSAVALVELSKQLHDAKRGALIVG